MARWAIALLAVLAAACDAGAPAPVPASPPPVRGIEAEVVRMRTDVAIGDRVHVRITDTGDQSFTVTALALESPGFAPLPAGEVTAEFAPGRRIALPVAVGETRCDEDPRPVGARLAVTRPGGAVEDLRVPLAGDDLELLHAERCAVAGVLAVVDVAVEGLAEDRAAVTGTVVLARAGGDEAVVAERLGRSVLVDVEAPALPVTLGGGAERVAFPVSFAPATCEPHVLAETKQPFAFPLSVRVGGGEPVPVPLPLDDAQRGLLLAAVDLSCGVPG